MRAGETPTGEGLELRGVGRRYGAAFAVAGALVSRQEDLQHSQTPISTCLFLAYAATFAVASNLESTATVLSMIPPMAPMPMPVRIAAGAASPLEVALSVLLSLAAIVFLVRFAARVYERAVLRFGARVKLREALKAA